MKSGLCIQFETKTSTWNRPWHRLIIFTFVQWTSGVNIELCIEFDLKSHLKLKFQSECELCVQFKLLWIWHWPKKALISSCLSSQWEVIVEKSGMNLQMWTEFDVNQILNRTELEMHPNGGKLCIQFYVWIGIIQNCVFNLKMHLKTDSI